MRRLTRSAFLANDEPSYPKDVPFREQSAVHHTGNLEPPTVKSVTHHSVELEWTKPSWSLNKMENKLKYSLQEEDKNTGGTGTVYIGYGLSHVVEGLDALQFYKYRLKVTDPSGEIVSPYIEVQTTKEPYNGRHLHKAVSQNNNDLVLRILSSQEVSVEVTDELGYTPLMNASQKKYLNIVNTLLEHGADVNAQNASGRNSLMLACFGGSLDVVKRLRVAGAPWNSSDRGGSFPIHWAMDSGNLELIEWMISDGADVNVHDNTAGWTPLLRCSALSGNVDMARILIKNGAKVNVPDHDGKTPLMNATLNGHSDLVKELVENGADVKVQNKYGKCAIDMAKSFDRRKILSYFEGIIEQENE